MDFGKADFITDSFTSCRSPARPATACRRPAARLVAFGMTRATPEKFITRYFTSSENIDAITAPVFWLPAFIFQNSFRLQDPNRKKLHGRLS
ncbi:hypothetical protein [Kaistia sp. UC242_56]|uniref:hypothetical protein n=1 Tax=Kaistia sp. UC242_56 TaxID=3374625 RepID=UPI0037A05529